ncbi:hypothetical protein BXT86_06850 [candidate division WOR-3 bacterium 4484_100]|uniref:DUF3795 domain-containing protein n=1 Tax=candidate division WOR-3 bacterium 4484_100 TaxID=1936077 RepID=A0A1V4QF67_UNCW3|nr:MAG: hypothetical protein BXT86_06850 [candidate division WOR-3 bacterium 4484_100]
MNYEQEKKDHISFCGSYCHICDWHTGKIRRIAQTALDMIQEFNGFKRLFEGKVDADNLQKGLRILATSSICSGCKSETGANERCAIRRCCSEKGFDLCNECPDFPCETLKNNPGVIRWHCLEHLNEIKERGLKNWIDQQWTEYIKATQET